MERSFEDAFFWSLKYDGWDMHADAMYEYLRDPAHRDEFGNVCFPHGASACVTYDDVERDSPNSILWMCLVQMFGDCGASPRYGWILRPDEACAWLRRRQRATYHCGQTLLDDGGMVWSQTDEDIRDAVVAWESAHAAAFERSVWDEIHAVFERAQDRWIAACEEENHGRLSDAQYAACLRAYARSVDRMTRAFDDSIAYVVKGSDPIGATINETAKR